LCEALDYVTTWYFKLLGNALQKTRGAKESLQCAVATDGGGKYAMETVVEHGSATVERFNKLIGGAHMVWWLIVFPVFSRT
jgi:hypothetical protein